MDSIKNKPQPTDYNNNNKKLGSRTKIASIISKYMRKSISNFKKNKKSKNRFFKYIRNELQYQLQFGFTLLIANIFI